MLSCPFRFLRLPSLIRVGAVVEDSIVEAAARVEVVAFVVAPAAVALVEADSTAVALVVFVVVVGLADVVPAGAVAGMVVGMTAGVADVVPAGVAAGMVAGAAVGVDPAGVGAGEDTPPITAGRATLIGAVTAAGVGAGVGVRRLLSEPC